MQQTDRNEVKNYIFYGTLRDPDILTLVAGHLIAEKYWQTTQISGYALHFVENCSYPALKQNPLAAFSADLYLGLSPEEQRAIYDYEGDEYEIASWHLHGLEFQIFLPRPSVRLSDREWDLPQFQKALKSSYLAWLSQE